MIFSLDAYLSTGRDTLCVQHVGVDDTGYDVKFFGATASAHLLWDESADALKLVGGALLDCQGTVTVGVDDTGYDVKFFGATTGTYWLWDESADHILRDGGTIFTKAVAIRYGSVMSSDAFSDLK